MKGRKSSRIDISWVYCGGQSSSKTWLGEPTSSSLGSAALGSVGRCGVKELARLTANHHNQYGNHQKPSKEHEGKAGLDHELEILPAAIKVRKWVAELTLPLPAWS